MSSPKLPFLLSEGAIVGGFGCSDPLSERSLEGIKRGTQLLESSGLGVHLAPSFAGTSSNEAGLLARVQGFNSLIADASVAALMATGGGKSANAILETLDYDLIAQARKPILGFSDACAILNAITAQSGLVTFYGPNVLAKLDLSRHYDLAALLTPTLPPPRGHAKASCLVPGQSAGRLIGGNLSAFATGIAGTAFEPQFGPSVLIWEAGGRDWPLIARYLGALRARGVHDRLSGMIVGKIGEEDWISEDELQLLRELVTPFDVPVLLLPTFGHGYAENEIWPLGSLVRLDATGKVVSFLEPMVAAR